MRKKRHEQSQLGKVGQARPGQARPANQAILPHITRPIEKGGGGHLELCFLNAENTTEEPQPCIPSPRVKSLLPRQQSLVFFPALPTPYITELESLLAWPGGGGIPLYKPQKYVPPQRVGILRHFDLKTGIDLAYFDLESGMVFKPTTESV